MTTSYLTHAAIERHLKSTGNLRARRPGLSLARAIDRPAADPDDPRPHFPLGRIRPRDASGDQAEGPRDASRRAILEWAKSQGEGSDYTDNVPIQRFNPPGHFYEVPNLLGNGVLRQLLDEYPNLEWLLVHNIDTLGATVDPGVLGPGDRVRLHA